jgi:large subunit ribosomal protein L21
MYAVIKTGGKQYRVAKDDVLTVEKIAGDKGGKLEFTDVLMVGGGDGAPKLGSPLVSGAKVVAEVVEQTRGPKLIAFKKRRRKNSRRKRGHRQDLTKIRITAITA